jgi:hypothetical protein
MNCSTNMTISEICRSVGFNTNEMTAIIYIYAERNEIMHADLGTLIRAGRFNCLAARLYSHFYDVPRVIPAVAGVEANLLSKLVDCMINQ